MKRFLSLFLTLAMVLSLMAGICIGVSAEEYTMIGEASLTGTEIPELAVGDTLPALSYSVPAGANYTFTANWLKNGSDIAEGTLVETGNSYTLQISVIANDGYAFNQDEIVLLINGEECGFVAVDARGEGGFGKCIVTKDYSFQEAIEKVEAFYNIPEMGKPLGEITIPDGVNYTLLPEWWDYNAEDYVPADTVVVKGGIYAAQIRLFPVAGYEFTEDTEVWINGELVDPAAINFDIINYWSDNYNFGEPVSTVSITHAEPELGKTFPVPAVTGENCVLEYYDWYDSTADEYAAADAVVELGHEYYLCVAVGAAPGYRFTDETKVMVNGAEPENFDIYDTNVYYYSEDYDFRQAITEVSLTCPAPEVGKDLPAVTAPADAGYDVSFMWEDMYTWEVAEGKVKDGGKYEVSICAEPKAGYYFAEAVKFTYNGKVVDEDDYSLYEDELYYSEAHSFAKLMDKLEISYELPQIGKAPGAITIPKDANYTLSAESGWYEYLTGEKVEGKFEDGKRYEVRVDLIMDFGYEVNDATVVYINGEKTTNFGHNETMLFWSRSYTFAKTVAEVKLPAWPQLKVGDKLPKIEGAGEHYRYSVMWEGYDAEGNTLEGDTVQDGAVYYATICAIPEKGYEFTEETKVTLGGKALSGMSRNGYDFIEDTMIYNFGAVKLVEKVELITKIPGYGEKGGEVKVPENAGYLLEGFAWGVTTDADYDNAEVAKKAYTYGDHVLLAVQLYTDEGYIFAPGLTITVDGKEYEPVDMDQYNDYIYVFYDLGEITKPAATPETGDTTPVMLLSFLCLSALAGASLLLSKKRIAR